MDVWVILIGFIALFLIGWLRVGQGYRAAKDSLAFLQEYSKQLNTFVTGYFNHQFDSMLNAYLMANVTQIQEALGQHAVMTYVQMPYTREVIYNYQLFPNVLPQFRSVVPDERVLRQLTNWCEDALLRGQGVAIDRIIAIEKEQRNPLAWLREGVRFLVDLPLHFLRWSGLDRYGPFHWFAYSGPGRFITVVGWILTWTFAIIGVIADWQPFVQVVQNALLYRENQVLKRRVAELDSSVGLQMTNKGKEEL